VLSFFFYFGEIYVKNHVTLYLIVTSLFSKEAEQFPFIGLSVSSQNSAKIRPFIGFSTGMLKLDDDSLSDTNGYYYGGNFGLIFYATDTTDIDLSYHYNIIRGIEDADNAHGARLSLHYFF